jgi:hypothetical protein
MTKKHCASCGLPVKFIKNGVNSETKWAWVHDATLNEILRQCVRLGVPPRHSLVRMTPTLTKEASFDEDRNESDGDAA